MKLTSEDKVFIIKGGDTLQNLFLNRIEDLKEEVTHLPRGESRDAKVELIQEFRTWLKDFRAITNPEPKRKHKDI
jgi:hypothetical protein